MKRFGGIMKKELGLWQLMGFSTASLGGTILHFLYDWLGGSGIRRAILRGKRIDLGAYEAALLTDADICYHTRSLLP